MFGLKAFVIATTVTLLAGVPLQAHAEMSQDDRVRLQTVLMEYIDGKSVDGRFLHFDAERQEMVQYYPANLHPMIIPKGDIYFLCADFRDETGGEIEVDFIATRGDSGFQVIQTMVNNRDVIRQMMQAEN